jgi:1-deoxy-D-xylulose-5-phosphate synthase
VVNARFIKPLDSSLIQDMARRTRRLVTVEENAVEGGFGSAVAELLESAQIPDVRLKCIGVPDVFVEHGPPNTLRAQYGLDAAGIEKGIASFFTDLIPLTETKK